MLASYVAVRRFRLISHDYQPNNCTNQFTNIVEHPDRQHTKFTNHARTEYNYLQLDELRREHSDNTAHRPDVHSTIIGHDICRLINLQHWQYAKDSMPYTTTDQPDNKILQASIGKSMASRRISKQCEIIIDSMSMGLMSPMSRQLKTMHRQSRHWRIAGLRPSAKACEQTIVTVPKQVNDRLQTRD